MIKKTNNKPCDLGDYLCALAVKELNAKDAKDALRTLSIND